MNEENEKYYTEQQVKEYVKSYQRKYMKDRSRLISTWKRKRRFWVFLFSLVFLVLLFSTYIISLLIYNGAVDDVLKTVYTDNTDSKFEFTNEYPLFDGDYVNTISTDTIRAHIRVNSCKYRNVLGYKFDASISYGSGVIYSEDTYYYYALTNAHVIGDRNETDTFETYIFDYKGRITEAEIMKYDKSYDLAVLKFKKNNSLKVLEISNELPLIGDNVVALGNPEGQYNFVCFGEVDDFELVNDGEELEFKCIKSTCLSKGGSSGGALINEQYEIVGINTYGNTENYTWAVPCDEILEFLAIS